MAKVEHGAQGWHLQNLGITGLAELGPEKQVLREVAVGDRLPLSEGTVLRLGSAPDARFCFVQWVR